MKTDQIFGVASAVLALLFVVILVPSITGDWQQGEEARYFTVGPRLFPYIAGGLTLIFAVLIAVRPDGQNRFAAFSDPLVRRNVIFAIVLAAAYVALLETLGFILSSVLTLIAFFIGFGERRWYMVLPIAVAVPVVVLVIFAKFFKVTLPTGFLALPL